MDSVSLHKNGHVEGISVGELKLEIEGMHCAGCVSSVEKALRGLEGVETAEVNLPLKRGKVEYDPAKIEPGAIESAVKQAGFSSRRMLEQTSVEESIESDQKEFLETQSLFRIALFFSVPLLLFAMGPMLGMPLPGWLIPESGSRLGSWIQLLLTLPVLFAGRDFYLRGLPALWKRHPDMDSLVALGTLAAFGYSSWNLLIDGGISGLYFETAALIITLILLGRMLESRSRRRAVESVRALLRLRPKQAMLLSEEGETPIDIELLHPGDRVRVRPGETLPADGLVEEGASEVDESMLTGESIPRSCSTGDEVTGGTLCVNGMLTLRVRRIGEESTLARIIRMVEEAQSGKAPVARMADRVAGVFVPVVLVLALLTALSWWLAGAGTEMVLTRMVAVLVIACPCALGLATPIAILVGTGSGARHGILFRNAAALESLQRLDTLMFDKTGTLTLGKPVLEEINTWNGWTESEVLRLAAAAETGSEHPFGKAIVEAANSRNITFPKPESFEALTGSGVNATVENQNLIVGRQNYILAKAENKQLPEGWDEGAEAQTSVWMLVDGTLAACMSFQDLPRPESKEAVAKLRSMGLNPVMLTGDRLEVAEYLAHEAGLDEIRAGLLPQDKVNVLKEYQTLGHRVGMVGDGINDAPALATADVGIGMGSGTDVALETADVVLMKNNLSHLADAFRLSRATLLNIRQNLFWAFAYNVLGIPVAAGVLIPFGGPALHPVLAAAAMALSSVSVVSNALRLKNFRFAQAS